MKILSWNVNGIRSICRKGFYSWLNASDVDIIGVQEVRANIEDIPKCFSLKSSFYSYFISSKKKGYSGVGLFSKIKPDYFTNLLNKSKFDDEGRIQMAFYNKLILINVYFPNGGGKNRDNSRIPYKLSFYRALLSVLLSYKKNGFYLIIIGDFNIAHKEIDLANPKSNRNTSGFCDSERMELDFWINSGFIDTFREFNKDSKQYTWWSNMRNSRVRNIGWRIDYILACKESIKYVKNSFIYPNIIGSDHCPIGIEVNDEIFKLI